MYEKVKHGKERRKESLRTLVLTCPCTKNKV